MKLQRFIRKLTTEAFEIVLSIPKDVVSVIHDSSERWIKSLATEKKSLRPLGKLLSSKSEHLELLNSKFESH